MRGILMGMGVSSSIGYKPFIPLIIVGISSKLGIIELANQNHWISSTLFIFIMIAFTILDMVGTSIPFVGRLFEVASIPITLIGGYLVTTLLSEDMFTKETILKPIVGILFGSGSAGLVKVSTIIQNALTDTVTMGVSSVINSIKDSIKSFFISILAILAPILAGFMLAFLLFITYMGIKKIKNLRKPKAL